LCSTPRISFPTSADWRQLYFVFRCDAVPISPDFVGYVVAVMTDVQNSCPLDFDFGLLSVVWPIFLAALLFLTAPKISRLPQRRAGLPLAAKPTWMERTNMVWCYHALPFMTLFLFFFVGLGVCSTDLPVAGDCIHYTATSTNSRIHQRFDPVPRKLLFCYRIYRTSVASTLILSERLPWTNKKCRM